MKGVKKDRKRIDGRSLKTICKKREITRILRNHEKRLRLLEAKTTENKTWKQKNRKYYNNYMRGYMKERYKKAKYKRYKRKFAKLLKMKR